MGCIRILILVLNLIFFLAGVATITIGVIAATKFKEYLQIFNDLSIGGVSLNSVTTLLIGAGCVVTVISFFGCYGAWRKNACLTKAYAGAVLGLVFLQITAVVLVFVFRAQIEASTSAALLKTIGQYDEKGTGKTATVVNAGWNLLQETVFCCGVANYEDWLNSTLAKAWARPNDVPDSCCRRVTAGCGAGARQNQDPIYTEGCLSIFSTRLSDNFIAAAAICIAVFLVEILIVVLACCAAKDFD